VTSTFKGGNYLNLGRESPEKRRKKVLKLKRPGIIHVPTK